MALKLFKVLITLEIKADKGDSDDTKERVYEQLQMLMESEELDFVVDEEEEEIEDES